MNRETADKIKILYDTENDKYVFNSDYSNSYRFVYIRPDKPFEWLNITEKQNGSFMVTKTDNTGFITKREIYKSNGESFECIHSESFKPKRIRKSLRARLEEAKIKSKELEMLKQGGYRQNEKVK